MIELPASKRGNIITDLAPDLTPLLDVMFMLIVFFILTANSVNYVLDVNLPKDNDNITKAAIDPNILSVTLLPNTSGWKINNKTYIDENEFKKSLQSQALNDKKLIIIGDKNVSMEKLLNLMTFLRKNNIQAAEIMMDKN